MSDRLISWCRTVVPVLWSTLIAWLVAEGVLPESWVAQLNTFGQMVLIPLVLGAVYAGLRWLEPRMPDWLTRILLGSAKPPIYPGKP